MKKIFLFIFALIAVGILIIVILIARQNSSSVISTEIRNTNLELDENHMSNATATVSIVAENLYVPWSLDFLPNGDLILVERNGNLKVIGENSITVKVPDVSEAGEGGLLGLALHPDFVSNKFIYLYFTVNQNGEITNKVVRYLFENNNLVEDKTIIANIPGGRNHNGGRIIFGPDGLLYVTTGDSGNSSLSQDVNSLAGKILRVTHDGEIPEDNPFGNAVYSYGHRNPQGLAFDAEGNLWETEHGRSGVQSGLDEINFIVKGGNYGWPTIQGNQTETEMISPVIHSGTTTTWAPSGIAFKDDRLYFVGLRGEALYGAEILSGGILGEIDVYLKGEYGRLRGIVVGPDNNLYITTSNRDGRGSVRTGDDKILKILMI